MNSTSIQLVLKEWESNFFNKKIYDLLIKEFESENLSKSISDKINASDFDIVEVNVNTKNLEIIPFLEDLGFRLTDSRIQFITLTNREEFVNKFSPESENLKFRLFEKSDIDSIQDLTYRYFTLNNKFKSRYKNERYFSTESSINYYTQWISYSCDNPNSIISVCLDQDNIVGYFIYERKEKLDQYELFKGILCVVNPEYQGLGIHLKLQAYIFKMFDFVDFYIDNTTQISNYPTVKNHIKSRKKLNKIELTFNLRRLDFQPY